MNLNGVRESIRCQGQVGLPDTFYTKRLSPHLVGNYCEAIFHEIVLSMSTTESRKFSNIKLLFNCIHERNRLMEYSVSLLIPDMRRIGYSVYCIGKIFECLIGCRANRESVSNKLHAVFHSRETFTYYMPRMGGEHFEPCKRIYLSIQNFLVCNHIFFNQCLPLINRVNTVPKNMTTDLIPENSTTIATLVDEPLTYTAVIFNEVVSLRCDRQNLSLSPDKQKILEIISHYTFKRAITKEGTVRDTLRRVELILDIAKRSQLPVNELEVGLRLILSNHELFIRYKADASIGLREKIVKTYAHIRKEMFAPNGRFLNEYVKLYLW